MDDLIDFLHVWCSKLFLLRIYNVEEFSTVTKSLPQFIINNRSVKLIIVDGLHHFDHKDIKLLDAEDTSTAFYEAENFFDDNYVPEDRKERPREYK